MTSEAFVEVVAAASLRERVEQLGEEISRDYVGREPVLVGVLKGSMLFLADLMRSLPVPAELDFLALTRFGGGGRVSIAMDTELSLEGRDVIIVEDIVDTGLTLAALHRLLELRGVTSLATVTLVDKAARRIVDVPLEYRGFEVGDEFLLGYGLDWDGLYRNLPSLWAVMDMTALADDRHALAGEVFGHPASSGLAGDRLQP
jgi:hypoxanthine phosphoribosyltransferase